MIELLGLRVFQTCREVLRGSCLAALILSLLIFPVWYQIFNSTISVSVNMAAPSVKYVRAYWNDPIAHPDAYERIAIKPSQTLKTWNIQIEALGERNPRAKWSQVWVLNINTPQQRIDWSDASLKSQSWEFRTDSWLPGGKALLANRDTPQRLTILTQGGDLTIKLLRSDYSGKVRITVDNEIHEIDLYSPTSTVEELKFRAVEPGDTTVRNYQLDRIQITPWQKLILAPENQSQVKFKRMMVQGRHLLVPQELDKIKVEQITVQGLQSQKQALQISEYSVFFLPSQVWHLRILAALVSTIISFFWMMGLFVSCVHIWLRQRQARFGAWSYILGLAIALGGFWMLVFYPARMTVDSLFQWIQALENKYCTWAPPLTAMLMRLTILFSNQPDLFCFLQGTLFWFAIFYLASQVIQNDRLFLFSTLFFTLLPTLWIYSATLVTNVNFASFALLTAAFCIKAIRESRQQWLRIVIIPTSLAIATRHDAIFIALAPALLAQRLFIQRYPTKHKLARRLITAFLIILLTLLPAKLLERLSVVTNFTPIGFAFINQYVGTIHYAAQAMSQDELSAEKHAIDTEFGAGTFESLLNRYRCDAANYIQWVNPIIINSFRVYQSTPFILQSTAKIILRHPVAYVKHKLCNLSYSLQIPNVFYFYATTDFKLMEYSKSLLSQENAIDAVPRMAAIRCIPYNNALSLKQGLSKAGIIPDSNLVLVRDGVLNFVKSLSEQTFWSLLFRHYLFLIMSGCILIISILYRDAILSIPTSIGLLSFCGFLIPDTFPDWRHLLFAYICAWMALLRLLDSYLGVSKSSDQT